VSRLADKVAVVLGAGAEGNMGDAIARRFAAEGARVVIPGRNPDPLERLARDIDGIALTCDVTSRASLDGLAADALDRCGRIDIAVNCVGLNLSAPFLETSEDDLRRLWEIQFKGPYQFLQVMVAAMPRGGSIVQIGSAAGTVLFDDYAAYRGTKAGIDQVVRSVADEFGAQGIRVNTLSPGAVRTPMTEAVCRTPALALFERSSPLGRLASVEEIAAAALWLAEDECFMTGENLHVSGGLLLRRNPTKREVMAAMATESSE
jgi:NAD(P)-dependent dehydrogenase (short-subunit alcohol dehydrogenase family)